MYRCSFVWTLVMLNKLRCHAHFQFSANQITWSRLLIKIHVLNGIQNRSRSVGFFRSQLIWIYTVCKGLVYLGSAGHGLRAIPLKSNRDDRCYCFISSLGTLLQVIFCRCLLSVAHLLAFHIFKISWLTWNLADWVTCRSKIAKIVLNWYPRCQPAWKSILNYFSWTERPTDSFLEGT